MVQQFSEHILCNYLTFTIFWGNPADNKLMTFFLLFLENRFWHFIQTVPSGGNLHGTSKPIFLRKIRKISKLRLIKIFPKTCWYWWILDTLLHMWWSPGNVRKRSKTPNHHILVRYINVPHQYTATWLFNIIPYREDILCNEMLG